MNIFTKVANATYNDDTRLGMPAPDIKRRMTTLSAMTGGRGFRQEPKEPEKDAQGRTRGDRKRERRATANSRVSEVNVPEFMHSAARRRLAA